MGLCGIGASTEKRPAAVCSGLLVDGARVSGPYVARGPEMMRATLDRTAGQSGSEQE